MNLPSKEYNLNIEEVRIISLALTMQSLNDLLTVENPNKTYPNLNEEALETMAKYHKELVEQRNKIIKKLT